MGFGKSGNGVGYCFLGFANNWGYTMVEAGFASLMCFGIAYCMCRATASRTAAWVVLVVAVGVYVPVRSALLSTKACSGWLLFDSIAASLDSAVLPICVFGIPPLIAWYCYGALLLVLGAAGVERGLERTGA